MRISFPLSCQSSLRLLLTVKLLNFTSMKKIYCLQLTTVLASLLVMHTLVSAQSAQVNTAANIETVRPSPVFKIPKADFSKPMKDIKKTGWDDDLFEKKEYNIPPVKNGPAIVNNNVSTEFPIASINNCPNPPLVQTNFEGNQRNRLNHEPLGWFPSECNIAISNKGKIVSISGSWMYFFDESGTLIFSDSLYHFGNGILDVHVLYDPKADRFIFVINRGFTDFVTYFEGAPPAVAFSKTNNPMDGWNYYIIPATDYHDGSIQDFPLIGISDNEVFLTSWYSTNVIEHREIVQMNKSEGYAGAPSLTAQKYDVPLYGNLIGRMEPAQGGSTTYGPNMYFLMTNEHSNGANKYNVYEITNTIASGQAVLNKYGPVSSNVSYSGGNGWLYQYGGLLLEDQAAPKNEALQNAFYENGMIQFCQVGNAGGNGKAAAIVGRITGIPNNMSCTAKLISDPNLYLSFPSIAYAGNSSSDNSAIVGLQHSGDNIYPGLSAVYVTSDFDISSLVMVKAGNDTINGAYGDYSGICRRFNHPGEVWFEGQYGSQTDKKINWIAKLKKPAPCLPTTVSKTLPENQTDNLLLIAPNPFLNSTTISFSLARSQKVSLNIYDVAGALVKSFLTTQTIEPGMHHFTWNGKDEKGNALPAGIYFVKFTAGNYSEVKKVSTFNEGFKN
jgi:hypothetical protein